jgi:hypothetical protein
MSSARSGPHDTRGPACPNGGSIVYPSALVVSLSGLVLSFIAYYPAAMSWDSFVMWGMGWEWPWHDWHSPYIPLLMGVSRRLRGDPSALLFLQLFLSWGGLYLSACGLRRRSPVWGALLPALGFTPMFLVVSGYLHKTPLQASVFLFVFGALFYHHQWRRRLSIGWTVCLSGLMLFAIPLRAFGLLCALPLAAFLLHCRSPRAGSGAVAASLIAGVALGGTSLAVHHLVVYHVLSARKLHKVQTLYRYDLAAVYALTGIDYAPRMIRRPYRTPASMQRLYEQADGMWRIIYAYEGGIPSGYAVRKDVPERLLTDCEVAYYRAAWLSAMTRHPGVYLRHKVHAFATSLGLGANVYGFRRAATYRSRQNIYGLEKRGGPLYRSLNRYMKHVEGSLLLKPWLWMVVAACLLTLGSVMYRYRPSCQQALMPILLLLVSGALLYPQLLLVGLDHDIRFSYWAIVSSSLALYLFLTSVCGMAWNKRA